MEAGSKKYLLKIEDEINRLTVEELRILNGRICEKLRLMNYARQARELAKFSLHDRVSFKHENTLVIGTILRLNRKSATILTDSGVEWLVSPSHLSKIIEGL